jgi:hypothetical protein
MIAGVPSFGQRGSTETIDATAFGTSTQLGRNFGIKIIIYEFSSPEDRDVLIQAFQKGQNDGLRNAFEKMTSVGRITIPGTVGYDLSYIREIITATGRTIRFVTNRVEYHVLLFPDGAQPIPRPNQRGFSTTRPRSPWATSS